MPFRSQIHVYRKNMINLILDQYGFISEGSSSAEMQSVPDTSEEKAEEKAREDSSDTDLEIEDAEKSFAAITGAELYIEACKLVGVVPVSYFLRNMDEPVMNLNHHGLGPKGTKAIAIALVSNTTITHLELEDNWILAEGTTYLVQMLRENCYIQEMVSNLCLYGVSSSFTLMFLSLGNNFREEAALYFSESLMANGALKILNLSWNGFGNEGALALGEALKVNNVLMELDISSNHINNEGTIKLCKGLEVNGSLRILKVESHIFPNCSRVRKTLRLAKYGMCVQCGNEVTSVQIWGMAHNPMTVEGAIVLLISVRKNSKSRMEEINISNVLVNESFVKLLDAVCEGRPELDVIFGGIGGHVTKKPEERPDAMKLIQNYLDANKLRLWDFFRNIDKNGNMKIPVAEFRRAMMLQSKIPLDRMQVRELIRKLDQGRTGHVDYR
uniref:Leucine rich repeat containing 74A n=1 Tax=Salvator merianae TaxID=96440 RepID=A0A8D0C1Z6_SALMN